MLRELLRYKVAKLSEQIAENKSMAADGHPHIRPGHPNWSAYLAQKKEISFWLTALSLLNRNVGPLPTKAEAAAMFREHNFANHARKGRAAKNLYFKAFRRLQKMSNRLETEIKIEAGSRAALQGWANERQREIETRRAEKCSTSAVQ